MPKSPESASSKNISFTISIEGKEFDHAYPITNIEVNHHAYRISTASFTVSLATKGQISETFDLSESDDFIPGKKLEIKAGYDQKNELLFKGIISSHNLYVKGGIVELEIACHNEAIKMTNSTQTRIFENQTDSEIIQTITKDHQLGLKVDQVKHKYPLMIQQQATDWDFVVARAQANGFLVATQNGTLQVQEPAKSTTNASLKLTFGQDVYEFQGKMSATQQIPSFKASSWDDAQLKKVEGESQEPKLAHPGNFKGKDLASKLGVKSSTLQSPAPLALPELKKWGEASLLRSRLDLFRGFIKFKGNALHKVNELVELADFGKQFNGKTLVTGVSHEISEGIWTTQLTFGLSPEWFPQSTAISAPAAAGLLPAIRGLQIAVVKKIDEDPKNAFRVQVDLQNNTEGKQAIWARMIQSYATKDAGAFFYPEIGDEVLLGFLNEDPRFPVILGHLYSKTHKPAYTPDEKNTIKAFVSKEKLKIEMNDKDKTLRIETPGQQQVLLSDKDKLIELKDANGNTIRLSPDGIILDSATNIILKAKKDIKLEATGKIDQKAQANISLDGLNVSAKAKVGFEAAGNASAKLTAAGQLSIRGAMVMIN